MSSSSLSTAKQLSLEKKWSLYYWYDSEWKDVRKMCDVRTVHDFWVLYNSLPLLHTTIRCNFAFFHSDILPQWEEPRNIDGGKWTWVYGPDNFSFQTDWLTLLLLLIGETLDSSSGNNCRINGVVACTRNAGNRLSVWTSSSLAVAAKRSSETMMLDLGKDIQRNLQNQPDIQFKLHRNAIHHSSFFNTNAEYKLSAPATANHRPKSSRQRTMARYYSSSSSYQNSSSSSSNKR